MKYYLIIDDDDFVIGTDVACVDPVQTKKNAEVFLINNANYQKEASSVLRLKKILANTKRNSGTYRKTELALINSNKKIKNMLKERMECSPSFMPVAPLNGVAIEVDVKVYDRVNRMIVESNGRLINSDLEYVENRTGKKYFYQDENDEWQSHICGSATEDIPSDWICVGELNDDQRSQIKGQMETVDEKNNRLYNEKFSEFLNRIFSESQEFREYERSRVDE